MVTPPLTSSHIENRTEPRYNVSWRALLQLPHGQTTEVRVKDISESGMGLVSDLSVPNGRIMSITVGVPDLNDLSRTLALPGRIHVVFAVMQGHDFRVGARWSELSPMAQQLWRSWVHRMRNVA